MAEKQTSQSQPTDMNQVASMLEELVQAQEENRRRFAAIEKALSHNGSGATALATNGETGLAEQEREPLPEANRTIDYWTAMAQAGATVWMSPQLRKDRIAPIALLAPAAISFVDDTLARRSPQRAVGPAVVGGLLWLAMRSMR